MWQGIWLRPITRAAQRSCNFRGILVMFAKQGLTGIRHSSQGVSSGRICSPTVETVSWRIDSYYPNGARRALVDTEHNRQDRKAAVTGLTIIRVSLRSCPPGWHHTSGSVLFIRLTYDWNGRISASFDVPVLMIAEAQSEREKTETGTKVWHSLPCHDGMDTISHYRP